MKHLYQYLAEGREIPMANLLTGCRIVCSMLMLFFPVPSIWFAAMYLLGGLTDMLDGLIARRTHTASPLGARLDTAADFLFLAAALIRLRPFLALPAWLWIWTAVIAAVKIINVVSGLICHKAFVTVHSVMNKVTGVLLFLFPLTRHFMDIRCSAAIVCAVAAFAAIQEGHCIRTGRNIE